MMGNDTRATVEVRDLKRHYKNKDALKGVHLEVAPGTVHGLVGENGAGKTTLIKHLLGTLKAQEGHVRVFGMDPVAKQVDVLARIGYLSEDRDLPGWMRVHELMRYTQAFYPDWDEGFADSLLKHFELDRKARILQLSRGEKAKVGLVTALAFRPGLLLLDEPSSGLDPSSRRDILGAIVRTVADEGRTVLFSSHLLDEVERVADVITMLNHGEVILQGPLEDLKEEHRRLVLRFDDAPTTLPALPGVLHSEGTGREWAVVVRGDQGPLRDALGSARGNVVEEHIPSLEELFLAYVGNPAEAHA